MTNMWIVLDTNVLVSALWSPDSKPARILGDVLARRYSVCFDFRVMEEYVAVLNRPKFRFEKWQINDLLDAIRYGGISVIPDPLPDIPFSDESDRKFLEVAKFCHAPLITGNVKHYPEDKTIVTVAEFYKTHYETAST